MKKPEEQYRLALDKLNEFIDAKGLVHTPERESILEIVCTLKQPFEVHQVVEEAQKRHISRATVYNTMSLLRDSLVVHCLKRQYGQQRDQYELTLAGNNHMVVVCTRCGRVSEFRDAIISNTAIQRQYSNFRMQHFSMYVYGLCKLCRSIHAKGGDGKNF